MQICRAVEQPSGAGSATGDKEPPTSPSTTSSGVPAAGA